MDNLAYDIDKLMKFNEIDVKGAVERFGGDRQYFDELNKFIETSKRYLRAYTPSVVIYSEDVRKDFLSEVERIGERLTSLGMLRSASLLRDLAGAVANNSMKALSDGLLVFYCEMDIMAKEIASARAAETEKPVILAVDDKPELLSAMVNMLEDKYKVIAVTSGASAVQALENHDPELFLLDIEMPHMDGFELADMIRGHKRFAKSPIIFLTGKTDRADVETAVKIGSNDYLIKPVNKDLLVDRVSRHFGKARA